ncbi:MAG: hypothetical protein K0B15_00015 [Lentimicrobium sp.]|nr:hypothetical protein [Lentimicrobium sp.]
MAAFYTRIDLKMVNNKFLNLIVWIFGYAAEPLARKLKAKGVELIAPTKGFFVDDTEGPVSPGEIDRAKNWAQKLMNQK